MHRLSYFESYNTKKYSSNHNCLAFSLRNEHGDPYPIDNGHSAATRCPTVSGDNASQARHHRLAVKIIVNHFKGITVTAGIILAQGIE